jgi:hypothetical protein
MSIRIKLISIFLAIALIPLIFFSSVTQGGEDNGTFQQFKIQHRNHPEFLQYQIQPSGPDPVFPESVQSGIRRGQTDA